MRYMRITTNLQIFALALAIMLGLPAQRVSAAIIRVDEACSLHDATAAANRDEAVGGCAAGAGADTIWLSGDVTLSEELPVIKTVMAIEGDGHTISGDNRWIVFRVGERPFGRDVRDAEIKLSINRLSIVNSRSIGLGSAIYIAIGAEVNIYDSRISDNIGRIGGAIYNWDHLNIVVSSFTNNLAWDSGGAIENHGSATLEVRNSEFSDNLAGYEGGAIYSSASATVRTSSFVKNAALEGGAVWSFHKENLVHVEGNSFYGKTAGVRGGALHSTLSDLTLANTTVSGNSASQGGGMFFIEFAAGSTVAVSLRHVTIVNNHALDGEAIGGGARIQISNSFIIGNTGESRCHLQSRSESNLSEDGRCDADMIDGDPMLADFIREGGHHPPPARPSTPPTRESARRPTNSAIHGPRAPVATSARWSLWASPANPARSRRTSGPCIRSSLPAPLRARSRWS